MPGGTLRKSAAHTVLTSPNSSGIHCVYLLCSLRVKLQAREGIIMGTSSAVKLQHVQYPGVTPCVRILSHDKHEVVQGC